MFDGCLGEFFECVYGVKKNVWLKLGIWVWSIVVWDCWLIVVVVGGLELVVKICEERCVGCCGVVLVVGDEVGVLFFVLIGEVDDVEGDF